MTAANPDGADAPRVEQDVIESSPGRGWTGLDRLVGALPRSFGRRSVAGLAVAAALVGLGTGLLIDTPGSAPGNGSATADQDTASAEVLPIGTGSLPPLLAPDAVTIVGEAATGGTYTLGSASALPLVCEVPSGPERGVQYVSGPLGASAVTFGLAGATMTERLTDAGSVPAAAAPLRGLPLLAAECSAAIGVIVEAADRQADDLLGQEFLVLTVTRVYPNTSAATSTVVVMVRVGSTVAEFSLTAANGGPPDLDRLLPIARLGVQTILDG